MNTKIKYINAGTETLSLFVPARYLNNITAENSLFFAAFSEDITDAPGGSENGETPGEDSAKKPEESQPGEGDFHNMCGVILYKTDSVNHSDASLIYIFVKSEFRSKGVAKSLLKETLNVLKSNRKTNISCRIYTESIGADSSPDSPRDASSTQSGKHKKAVPGYEESHVQSLLESFGFKAAKSGDIMTFSMAHLLDTLFTPALMDKLRPYMHNVKKIYEIDKSLLFEFADFLGKKGRSSNLKTLDPEFTRYYIGDGKIIGYAAIKELHPEILLIEDTLTLHHPESNRVIPSIIAALLEYSLDYMFEDSVLAVDINNNKVKNAMISQFDKPALVKIYTEYSLSM